MSSWDEVYQEVSLWGGHKLRTVGIWDTSDNIIHVKIEIIDNEDEWVRIVWGKTFHFKHESVKEVRWDDIPFDLDKKIEEVFKKLPPKYKLKSWKDTNFGGVF